jgi:hypothetical protein
MAGDPHGAKCAQIGAPAIPKLCLSALAGARLLKTLRAVLRLMSLGWGIPHPGRHNS